MTKQKYRVLAATGFRGHKQGEEFEAELSPDEERRAKARGSIKAVQGKASAKATEKEGE